ncbi:MAG: IS1634 family transposase, partial [Candidatus Dormibacteraceae bacterium]
MYIRESRRTYKDKTYTNYVLVESVQTAKGPRQKTVCSLGDLGPRPREGWLKLAHKIADALVGQGDLIETADAELAEAAKRAREGRRKRTSPNAAAARPGRAPWIAVDPSRVTTEQHREAGPVHLGHQFWRRLGLDDILRACGLSEVVRQLVCVMVLNRLIAPASEHAMPDWARRTALADILGADFADLDEQPLYRVLDKLHPHRSAIEEALVARERGLFNLDSTIYLYDLTSTYFEGLAARNAKAQRGYSRDHRPDCKQVVVGLVVNRDGFPITHEVFAGNTQDRTTLPAMLDRLTARAGLQAGATVVVDRGMAYAENLAEIQRRGFHYVVATRQPERDRWLAEFEDTAGFTPVLRTPSPRNPAQKKTAIEIKTCAAGALTYVLCRSEQRIAKDQAIRSKQEGRLKADLDRLSQRLSAGTLVKPEKVNQAIGRLQERYPRVARYFRISHQPQTATLCCDFDA